MSRKYNCKHPDRGRSRYPLRLAKRGLSKAPAMLSLDKLREIQEARIRRGEPVWGVAA
jgi:hypothetical protein